MELLVDLFGGYLERNNPVFTKRSTTGIHLIGHAQDDIQSIKSIVRISGKSQSLGPLSGNVKRFRTLSYAMGESNANATLSGSCPHPSPSPKGGGSHSCTAADF